MKLILFAFLTTLTLLFSCSNNHETNSTSFKFLNDSLTTSTDKLKKQNDSLYKVFEQELQNEKTAEAELIWFPKTKNLQYYSDEIYKYIDTAISNLKSDSVLNSADSLYTKLDFYKTRF